MNVGQAALGSFENLAVSGKGRSLTEGGRIVAAFILATLALIAMGGTAARYLIPAATCGTAYLLYRRSPVTYVSFVWWVWFLVSFVRRLVDYRSGFADSNPILAAPFLASFVCLPSLFKHASIWKRRASLPLLLALSSSVYGLLVGVILIPKKILLMATLGWLAPLIFGVYIFSEYTNPDRASLHYRALQRTFCWGVLVMGAYGIVQFFLAPGWDVLWMSEIQMGSIGSPEPFGIRVFSTMNGPGALAYTLVAGLVLLARQRGLLPLLAGVCGYLTLLLSSVRSAWLAWLLAMLFLALRERKYLVRMAIGAGVLVACLAPAMAIDPINEMMRARVQSFTDLQNDTSFQDRRNGYEQMVNYAVTEPFGTGLGTMDAKFAGKTDLGTRDSGFWEIILSLGWIGGSLYLAALGIIAWVLLKPGISRTSAQITAGSISVGLIAQLLLGSVMLGVTGATIWMFAAIAMAGQEDKLASMPQSGPSHGN